MRATIYDVRLVNQLTYGLNQSDVMNSSNIRCGSGHSLLSMCWLGARKQKQQQLNPAFNPQPTFIFLCSIFNPPLCVILYCSGWATCTPGKTLGNCLVLACFFLSTVFYLVVVGASVNMVVRSCGGCAG